MFLCKLLKLKQCEGDGAEDASLHTMKLHTYTQIQIIFKRKLRSFKGLGSKRPKLVNKKIVKIMNFSFVILHLTQLLSQISCVFEKQITELFFVLKKNTKLKDHKCSRCFLQLTFCFIYVLFSFKRVAILNLQAFTSCYNLTFKM